MKVERPSHRCRLNFMPTVAMLVGFLWVSTQGVSAAEWYVATNGPGGSATNWATAKSNIQDAISLCSSGDVVWVSNGVYEVGGVTNYPTGAVLTNRVAITTAYVTVRSANNDPTNTIIKGTWDPDTTNGPAAVRCVYMTNGSTLIGFTLTKGATLATGASGNICGGGLYFISGAILSNCVLAANSAYSVGGGIYGYATLRNCTLSSNSANASGGGVYGATLYNCLLTANSAKGSGGGAYGAILYNCLLTNNVATYGGGAYQGTLYNCTLTRNTATDTGNYGGGGARSATLYNCLLIGNYSMKNGGGATDASTLYNCTIVGNSCLNRGGGVALSCKVANCIIYFNTCPAENYSNWDVNCYLTNCCTTPEQAGWAAGNITNDPAFIDKGSGYGTDHVAGNYRLSNVSPCINAGTNFPWMTDSLDARSKDPDNRPRLRYGRADMGCYEFIFKGAVFTFR